MTELVSINPYWSVAFVLRDRELTHIADRVSMLGRDPEKEATFRSANPTISIIRNACGNFVRTSEIMTVRGLATVPVEGLNIPYANCSVKSTRDNVTTISRDGKTAHLVRVAGQWSPNWFASKCVPTAYLFVD